MPKIPSTTPRPWRPRCARVLLLPMLALLLLSGCAQTPCVVSPPPVPGPQALKLPAVISQIDSSPSNRVLSEGSAWLDDATRLLSDVTQR